MAATGIFAALIGFASLFLTGSSDQLFTRARPLPILGVMPLGDNHNLIAEWFAFTIPLSIALALLVREERARRLLMAAAAFQTVIALLTFARTFWIVIAFEAILVGLFVWREQLRRQLSRVLVGIVLLIPLAAAMIAFSRTALVQSSTSTRLMLSEIAVNLWLASPWVGAGAGTFVDRVASIRVFAIEYGNPLDAHGFGQKLLAETGIFGVLAVAWLVVWIWAFVRDRLKMFAAPSRDREVFLILAIAATGAFVYQLFNTNYWTGKLWLPAGILLAASRALAHRAKNHAPTMAGAAASLPEPLDA